MTEIEKALLNALESLQSEHERQLGSLHSELQRRDESWRSVVSALRDLFERSQAENQELVRQVGDLSEQVSDLARQVRSLSAALPR
jgi:methyl-accepting chemotaxis protein